MRLLLVPDPTSPYGEDAFCREIAQRAAKRGHEASIAVIPNGPLEATLDTLKAAGFAVEADAVVINSLQPAALLAAKAAGRKAAVRFIESYAAASAAALAEVKRLALSADLLLVPSRHLAEIVKAWGGNGQIRHVPYAYDRIMAKQIKLVTIRASRSSFEMVAATPLNELTRPGLETLLSAAARLRIDWHLSVIGEGPAQSALAQRAEQLATQNRVSFLGPLPHAKAMEFFRAAKAFVDPCGLEGFPTLALHAMSEGCPVVAARTGPTLELLRHDDNGLLFSPGDAVALSESIMTLFSVRGLSLRLIDSGVKTVTSHSWDVTVAAVFDAVESLR